MHGYSTAVDLVTKGLADEIEAGNLQACLSDPTLGNLLEQRGYLTTRSEADEAEFVSRIKEMFWKKQPFLVDFALRLRPVNEGGADHLGEPGFIDNLFLAINELRGIHLGCPVEVDMRGAKLSPSGILPDIFSRAYDWGFKINLLIEDCQISEVVEQVEEAQVVKVSVCLPEADESWTAGVFSDAKYPFRHLLELVGKQAQVECLVNVDRMSTQSFDRLLDNLRAAKERIETDNDSQMVLVPMTAGADSPLAGVIPLREERLADYRQLENHLWSQRMVRFRPCFSPEDVRINIFSSGEIFQLTAFGRNRRQTGRVGPEGYEIESVEIPASDEERPMPQLPAECRDCNLSLMCGGNCEVWNPDVGEHFRQKAARLVTIPFINRVYAQTQKAL
jgi:radical SAM protein with 4Fe4S-binding SPASM domain